MPYTLEKVRAWAVEERHRVWKRARSQSDPEARELVKLIEQCGLPYSENAALTMHDPIAIEIYEIVNSEESKIAMIEATNEGKPAIDGIDRRLSEELGVDYGPHNQATNIAGIHVADCMRRLGYRKSNRKGRLTKGSVAKTAEIFVKK
jgi:hypothetical protein